MHTRAYRACQSHPREPCTRRKVLHPVGGKYIVLVYLRVACTRLPYSRRKELTAHLDHCCGFCEQPSQPRWIARVVLNAMVHKRYPTKVRRGAGRKDTSILFILGASEISCSNIFSNYLQWHPLLQQGEEHYNRRSEICGQRREYLLFLVFSVFCQTPALSNFHC